MVRAVLKYLVEKVIFEQIAARSTRASQMGMWCRGTTGSSKSKGKGPKEGYLA